MDTQAPLASCGAQPGRGPSCPLQGLSQRMTLYRSPLPIKAKAIVMVEATPTPLSYMLAMLNPETLRGGVPLPKTLHSHFLALVAFVV